MKLKLKQIAFTAVGATLIGLGVAQVVMAAGTATLSFSPSSGSVTNGNTLAVGVYENSGTDQINSVQANFSYPAGLLSCTSVASSSNFGVAPQSDCSGGSAKIARGAYSPVSGSKLIATVYFKALASSGTATLTFDASTSKVVRYSDSGSETLTVQDSSYTLKAPPSSGGSGSSGGGSTSGSSGGSSSKSSGGSTTSSSSSKSTSTAKKAAPAPKLTISDVSVSNLTASSATVSWKTSVPASSEVDYGTTASYGLEVVDSHLVTQHSLKLTPSTLLASLVYHFAVKSIDANGQSALSPDQNFETASDNAVKFGQPASQTSTYLKVALAAVGGIIVIVLAASFYIRHLHSHAAAMQAHGLGTMSSPTAPHHESDSTVITPHSHPPSDDNNHPTNPAPPGPNG